MENSHQELDGGQGHPLFSRLMGVKCKLPQLEARGSGPERSTIDVQQDLDMAKARSDQQQQCDNSEGIVQ